jgi:parallel beta-helix repeat protein
VVRGVDRDTVIVDGSQMYAHTSWGDYDSRDAFLVENQSFITFENFTIRNAPRSGIYVATSSHITVRDMKIHNNGKQFGAVDCYCWGIVTGFSEYMLVENNEVFNNGQHGIYIGNSADFPIIRNNLVYGNRTSGIQVNGDCLQGGDGSITGAVIENNILHDNMSKTLSIVSMSDSVIRNNLLYDNMSANGAGGIHLTDEPGCGLPSNNNLVVNNTIVEPLRAGIRITDNASGNVIFNNIIVSPNPIADQPENSQNFIDTQSNIKKTSATGLFVNADQHDFNLIAASPAHNPIGSSASRSTYSGMSAPTTDLDNSPRPMGGVIDLGAFEFVE